MAKKEPGIQDKLLKFRRIDGGGVPATEHFYGVGVGVASSLASAQHARALATCVTLAIPGMTPSWWLMDTRRIRTSLRTSSIPDFRSGWGGYGQTEQHLVRTA
jgi:hypothetical protein